MLAIFLWEQYDRQCVWGLTYEVTEFYLGFEKYEMRNTSSMDGEILLKWVIVRFILYYYTVWASELFFQVITTVIIDTINE